MPNLYFHTLPEPDNAQVFLNACAFLSERVYEKMRSAHLIVLCNSEDLTFFDDQFWTFVPQSFLPHQINAKEPTSGVIDLISSEQKIPIEPNIPNVLLNFSNQAILPSHPLFDSISAIHMIVGKSMEYREFCRNIFREYKKYHLPISTQQVVSSGSSVTD